MPDTNFMIEYKLDLHTRYWEYQNTHYPDWQLYFEKPYENKTRPPVFIKDQAWRNVITNTGGTDEQAIRLMSLIPESERHQWFRSMNSSQALAQSVLGNLVVHNSLYSMTDMQSDEGLPLLPAGVVHPDNFFMEHKINFLNEPRCTSLDGYFDGTYKIAIECKFTEIEVGACSRPKLEHKASNYELEHCNGVYSIQQSRTRRCALSEIGVAYWRYIPGLFKWSGENDLSPCPLNRNYQLVRNILAVGVNSERSVSLKTGHVILIYDQRNPAFQEKGKGLVSYQEVQNSLYEPAMIRKCSWQRITRHLREKNVLNWLTGDLAEKYGL